MNANGDPFPDIPTPIKSLPQWVVWRCEQRDGKNTKVPYCSHTPTRRASVDNPKDWGTYDLAVEVYQSGLVQGIGFVFTKDDPYCGIDLDKCRNPETGEIEPWTQEIIQDLNSYTEVSQSGAGVHIIVQGKLPPGSRRKGRVEMYDCGRYFCMTGNRLSILPSEAYHEG